jgi:hypothetical protein
MKNLKSSHPAGMLGALGMNNKNMKGDSDYGTQR